MKPIYRALSAGLALALAATPVLAQDDEVDNITATYDEGGKYFTEDDVPTFFVAEDGTVDWYTFSGFRRYHAECHVCHGPDGEGSTYAPALKESAIDMDYYDFQYVVVEGRKVVDAADNQVMPAFGLKMDTVPGRTNENWVRITKTGDYYGQCSELCGVGHAYMPIHVKAVSKEEFAAWVKSAQAKYADSMPEPLPGEATVKVAQVKD